MSLKNCPFCNNNVEFKYKDGLYLIECDNCKEKGISIKVQAKSFKELKKLWNEREFDNLLLNNTEYSMKLLSFLSGNKTDAEEIVKIESDERYNDYEQIMYSEDIFGYLVMPDGEVIECDEEHTLELMRYFGIDADECSEISNDELLTIAISNGMIRVSKMAKCLMIDFIPEKVSKKQLNNLSIFLMKHSEELSQIRLFCVYLNEGNKASDISQFDKLNDLILYLDEVK